MVTNVLMFYLAAATLLVLVVESCVRLLNRDSLSITLAVYVTVFAWYFLDPFLNPEQYDYLPPFLISQSYGQVMLFLIAFRFSMPFAVRWIVRRRRYGDIRDATFRARANLNRSRVNLAAVVVHWYHSDGR